MKNIKIENNCEHCAHGAKHYFIVGGTFRRANCLHCVRREMTQLQRESRVRNKIKCEYWQPEQILIDKRRESIDTVLRDAARKLNDVAEILREDAEKGKDRK